MDQGFLYVIAASWRGPCKLGTSANPDRRLKSLQTGHPEPLRIFHVAEVEGERKRAKLLERLLHRDIRYHRAHGEWFRLPVADAIGHVKFTLITYGDVEDLQRCFDRRW